MRLRITVAYVGTRYHGWQVQASAGNDLTVQALLEKALATLAREEVRIHGSGRTDAGVHAEGQVAHVDISDERFPKVRDWRHSLNALLPDDIRIIEAVPAPDDFHSRFSAKLKTYRYQFWQDRGFTPPRLVPFVWASGPLDRSLMEQGLSLLIGTHDFAAFANAGTDVATTVRTITEARILSTKVHPAAEPMLELFITGTGFLKQMVRNIAGLLSEIGRKRLPPSAVTEAISSGRRGYVKFMTAPPQGLTLMEVRYPGGDGAGRTE